MASLLLISVLEISKGISPDWKAADAKRRSLTDAEVWSVYDSVKGFGIAEPDKQEQRTAHQELDAACVAVRDGWEEQRSDFVRVTGKLTDMLVAAGESEGESVESVKYIDLFNAAGLAKSAGFLTESSD